MSWPDVREVHMKSVVFAKGTRVCGGLLACLIMISVSGPAGAVDHHNATVGYLQSTLVDTNCLYFTLSGVNQADPAVSGSPWFAISRSSVGAGDAYATLLAAKLSGSPLWIRTSGQMVCGYATAVYVILEQ
jgi:hypothetical protein